MYALTSKELCDLVRRIRCACGHSLQYRRIEICQGRATARHARGLL